MYPKIGVAIFVRRDNKILMHKLLVPGASFGHWALAGGHLEMFEGVEEGVLRELAEEAGPDVKVTEPEFWTIANVPCLEDNNHYVTLFFVADWISGEAQVMEPDKCEQWGWYEWDNLPDPLMVGIQTLKEKGMTPFKMNAIKEKRVFYINVGQLPPNRAEAFLNKMQDALRQIGINQDTEDYFVPVRDGVTKIEVFTKDDKDQWVKENSHVIEVMQNIQIESLEAKLELSRQKIEQLRKKRWWNRFAQPLRQLRSGF